MKTVNEFKNGVDAFIEHLFPTTSEIVIEHEVCDDIINNR